LFDHGYIIDDHGNIISISLGNSRLSDEENYSKIIKILLEKT